ncbi:hypothetical protein D3C71_1517750 [compost metagenome]
MPGGQPHGIGLEARLGADEAALAQGLQRARGGLIEPYLVVAHVDAEAEHGSRADEAGYADLEDDAFLYFLLCHPVVEMGQRGHQQLPDQWIVILPSPLVELFGRQLPQLGRIHRLPRSWICPSQSAEGADQEPARPKRAASSQENGGHRPVTPSY